MDALRNTLSLHSIKTRQIVYQDPSGSFPAVGAVLNVTDKQGHTDWTRDLSVNSVTLTNNISGPGVLTYSNTGVLLLNGAPVGGGGGGVVGGTNISVAGSTVNFDPTKGGGVNMLNSPLTNNARVEFGGDVDITCNGSSTQKAFYTTNAVLGPTRTNYYVGDYAGSGAGMEYNSLTQVLTVNNPAIFGSLLPGQGIVSVGGVQSVVGSAITELLDARVNFSSGVKNTQLIFDTASTNGTLTVTNSTGTPQFGTRTGVGGPSITVSSNSASNVNNIALVASNATDGTCSVIMNTAGGATSAAINYTEINDKLTITCTENLSLTTASSGQSIEMGSTLGQMLASTRDQPIVLMRLDAAGANIDSLLTMDFANTVKIGEVSVVGDPTLKFQSSTANAQLTLDPSDQLVISGSAGVSTQIATPLNDVVSGGPGVAGQVLTSQGAGLAPVWATGGGGGGVGLGILGRYWTKASETITINSTLFPGLPASGKVKMRIEMMGGGGGGGGGVTIPGGTGGNSAGGGGQGFVQSAVIIYPITEDLIIQIGSGGTGGTGGTIFGGATNGVNGSPTYLRHPISTKILATALGAYGGQTDGIGGGGLSNGVNSDNNPNGSPGGEGGGYYGGASGSNGGISGNTSSGTGCGGGGGYGGGSGSSGSNGGTGDCGSCLIEIIDLLP